MKIFRQICVYFEFVQKIDLFASRLNNRLKRYYSYSPDPKCEHVDAFTLRWSEDSYAFPPFIVLTRTLQKIEQDGITALLIAPYWPTQPYFSNLMRLSITQPFLLPGPPPLFLPWDREAVHPNSRNLHLISVMVSREQSKHKNSVTLWQTKSLRTTLHPHKNNTIDGVNNGWTMHMTGISTSCIRWPHKP